MNSASSTWTKKAGSVITTESTLQYHILLLDNCLKWAFLHTYSAFYAFAGVNLIRALRLP